MNALLIDFGSTYTKLRAVALEPPSLLAAGQGPSTVDSDICTGMEMALADLKLRLGELPEFRYRLACSSAAGGLRMVTVGLVRELTAEAARQAALGAGARLAGTFAQRLTAADISQIESLAPDILLLAGGTDGGNSDVILHNARALAGCRLGCPVVVAGNRAAADEVMGVMGSAAKPASVCENVMPEFGQLNVEPAREAIRKVFIDRIVHAKGIDRAGALFDRVLMPTPAAVMEGARLISEGHGSQAGIGPLMLVDIGGATTDVHSIADGDPTASGVIRQGLPEPYLKRTVEGDLGVRHNVRSVIDEAGIESICARSGLSKARVEALVARFAGDVGALPSGEDERALDAALASSAASVAARRHSGTIETVYTVNGPATIQRGKDLGGVTALIGTGGVLAHAEAPAEILSDCLADASDPFSLRPKRPKLLADQHYLLYAVGLLHEVAPEAAVKLGITNLKHLGEANAHEQSSAAG